MTTQKIYLPVSVKEYENNFIKMKAWNEKRAKSEEEGIKKFWKLKEMFKNENKR